MNKFAIMVDGEVVLEKDFSDQKVSRNVVEPGVLVKHTIEEIFGYPASDADIAALRKIKKESSVQVRITGDKGFVPVSKSHIEPLKDGIIATLLAFDSLNKVLAGHVPAKSTEK